MPPFTDNEIRALHSYFQCLFEYDTCVVDVVEFILRNNLLHSPFSYSAFLGEHIYKQHPTLIYRYNKAEIHDAVVRLAIEDIIIKEIIDGFEHIRFRREVRNFFRCLADFLMNNNISDKRPLQIVIDALKRWFENE